MEQTLRILTLDEHAAERTGIVVGMAAFAVRGLNLGIDFKGGVAWEVPANGVRLLRLDSG